MIKSLKSICIEAETTYSFYYETPEYCPHCHKGVTAVVLNSYCVIHPKIADNFRVFTFFFCGGCDNAFLCIYHGSVGSTLKLEMIAPQSFIPHDFSKKISEFSPDFIEIYTQADNAEQYGLTEICGVGYRKALEFLIKDFILLLHPSEKDKVEKQSLAKCINDYIDNPHIKSLATASAWLGNDEVHYSRQHPDYDLDSLKSFLNTAVAYVEMELNYRASRDLIDSKNQQ